LAARARWAHFYESPLRHQIGIWPMISEARPARQNGQTMRQPVLIINSGSIFDTSLLQLLKSATDLEVLDVSDRDEAALKRAIVQFAPRTVVINDSEEGGALRLLKLFSTFQFVQRLRVIVVQIADNVIQHYEIKQVIATESADLVALIRND
jgi:hypothetical protein